MIRSLYSFVMRMAQPLLRRKLRARAQAEPLYAHAIEERFGEYSQPAAVEGERPFVWVHAVSLGETRAAAALVVELRRFFPGMRLLLTHGTATGLAHGRGLLREGDVQVWQPWDTPEAVGHFLAHFRPLMGLLVETEVWPNMVAACQKAAVPLCLVNARMSTKTLENAQRLSSLSRPAYRGLHAVWAQTEEDANRLARLGARVCGVLGNFKYDAVTDPALLARGRTWRHAVGRPVVVFASSRDGEEAMLLDKLSTQLTSGVQWMIVPRHPQRFEGVLALCKARGLSVSRRSGWEGNGPAPADIWLGDSLGEMAMYYGMADVALLGGSFAPLGGQNLIEAAACDCPVVMGPHVFNFAHAAKLAQTAGAAFQEDDLSHAVDRALHIAQNPEALQAARRAAATLATAHQGAAFRTAHAVHAMMTAGLQQASHTAH
jgi:3-deoxy-D-manno-octulosonic-acid transferase